MFDLLGVARVEGSVETLPRVQGDGVLVPGTDHTQPAVGILDARKEGGGINRQTDRHTVTYLNVPGFQWSTCVCRNE